MTPVRYIRMTVFGDISQAEFSRLLGRRQATVWGWETGKSDVGLKDLRAMRAVALRKRLPWRDSVLFRSDKFLLKQDAKLSKAD